MSGNKRKSRTPSFKSNVSVDLEQRVKHFGGRSGYALGGDFNAHDGSNSSAAFQTPQIQRSSRRPFGVNNSSKVSTPFSFSSKSYNSRNKYVVTPATVRKRTANNLGSSSVHIVCAISENLARESCISSLDASSPVELCVTKQANGQTYAETLAYLELLQPHEILFNEGRRNSKLAQKIVDLFVSKSGKFLDGNINECYDDYSKMSQGSAESENKFHPQGECKSKTVMKFLPRIHFDQTKGAELLIKVARDGTYDASVVEEYIILASSHAVLHYTQHCLGAVYTKGSLHLSINSGGRGRMTIDRSSLLNLELLTNARTGKKRDSLLGTIDFTKTSSGARLLRTNLMAPPTSLQTINARLDLVSSLLEDQDLFYSVLEHLEALPEVDRMLSFLALSPKGVTTKNITARIASKDALERKENLQFPSTKLSKHEIRQSYKDDEEEMCCQESCVSSEVTDTFTDPSGNLSSALDDIMSDENPEQLLRAILLTFRQDCLCEVLNSVQEVFTQSTTYTRNSHAMRHQECFALKPNTNGMLDVVRKAFLANVDDIYRLADEYAETFDISVAVRETSARGYYLSIPLGFANALPDLFIQPVKSGRFIHCTTEEVLSLNARAQENVQDLLLMTHEKIQKVLEIARGHYDAIASLSDAIALLDMCHSFADNAASSSLPWCRPKLIDTDGSLAIRNGRFAIDTSGNGVNGNNYIPNDAYATPFQNFNILTGINGSGKSTYLKQVAINVILAQCGSYVPAEEAFIPIRDRLCTRIGTSDDQEHNISTFMQEMKETAFICNQCTDRSLVIIDELGRATSNEDGVAIAWAISEFLLVKRAITFFVTHYPQLTRLADVYSNIQNQHLGSVIESNSGNNVLYTHKVMPGPCHVSGDYGVEMAATCGWPKEVLNEARSLRAEVDEILPDEKLCKNPNVDSLNAKLRAEAILVDLVKHLAVLKESSHRLSETARRSYLEDLRKRVVPSEKSEVFKMMQSTLCIYNQKPKGVKETTTVTNLSEEKSSSYDFSSPAKPDLFYHINTSKGVRHTRTLDDSYKNSIGSLYSSSPQTTPTNKLSIMVCHQVDGNASSNIAVTGQSGNSSETLPTEFILYKGGKATEIESIVGGESSSSNFEIIEEIQLSTINKRNKTLAIVATESAVVEEGNDGRESSRHGFRSTTNKGVETCSAATEAIVSSKSDNVCDNEVRHSVVKNGSVNSPLNGNELSFTSSANANKETSTDIDANSKIETRMAYIKQLLKSAESSGDSSSDSDCDDNSVSKDKHRSNGGSSDDMSSASSTTSCSNSMNLAISKACYQEKSARKE